MIRCIIIAVLLSLICQLTSSSECEFFYENYENGRDDWFRMSPYIFLAEVVSSNKAEYQLKVLEVFKGVGVPKYIHGMHDEEAFVPFTDDFCWIVYAENAQLNSGVDLCSFSRSFKYPALPVKDMTLMIDYLTPASEVEENYRNKVSKGQKSFIEEIKWLRELRPIWESKYPLDDITGRYPDYGLFEL